LKLKKILIKNRSIYWDTRSFEVLKRRRRRRRRRRKKDKLVAL